MERTMSQRYEIWIKKNPNGTQEDFKKAIEKARADKKPSVALMRTPDGLMVPATTSLDELKEIMESTEINHYSRD